jgi:hypothetical protein
MSFYNDYPALTEATTRLLNRLLLVGVWQTRNIPARTASRLREEAIFSNAGGMVKSGEDSILMTSWPTCRFCYR